MRCPFCSEKDTKVVDSRPKKDDTIVRRRRLCKSCNRRFTTYEKVKISLPIVVKKDQRREDFDRDKIIKGLQQACQKRLITLETIEDLVDQLEKEFMERHDKEIHSEDIGLWLMARLRHLDQVAYVRFASVYRDFGDVEEFKKELELLSISPENL